MKNSHIAALAFVALIVFLVTRQRSPMRERVREEVPCPCRDKPQVLGVYMPSMNVYPMSNRPTYEYHHR
jgi:hypothetical protein